MTKFHRISSADQVIDWYKSTLIDEKSFQLAIVDTKTGQLIGYAGIAGLNEVDGNGEYFIFIGNKYYWGKGIRLEQFVLTKNQGSGMKERCEKHFIETMSTQIKLSWEFYVMNMRNERIRVPHLVDDFRTACSSIELFANII